jgi:diaminohydroxyphosphoribosylaminopyrimidine deaminase/5-amino-6-(5-phosphoribosylamino)uracil reductase
MSADSAENFMRLAIELAKTPFITPLPNPRVGAVIVRKKVLVGKGFHLGPGFPHAEVEAIRDAEKNGVKDFSSAEIFVNLEPCCHTEKRTPPCAPLLIEKKFKKIWIAHLDPNPKVSGRGVRALRKSGIQVEVGLLSSEAESINQAFVKNQKLRLPYVTLKIATTFDGKMADVFGTSKWITGESSRAEVHRLRAEADAIGVGKNTINSDNPSLNIRVGGKTFPRKVIIFGRPKTPLTKLKASRANGLENILQIASKEPLRKILRSLYRDHQISHLFVEGGPSLSSQLLIDGLVDKLLIFQGKGILGGKSPYVLGWKWGLKPLSKSIRFTPSSVRLIDRDIFIQGFFNVYRADSKIR